jgi:hypothetical protein
MRAINALVVVLLSVHLVSAQQLGEKKLLIVGVVTNKFTEEFKIDPSNTIPA